jgi:hypothetical protein
VPGYFFNEGDGQGLPFEKADMTCRAGAEVEVPPQMRFGGC